MKTNVNVQKAKMPLQELNFNFRKYTKHVTSCHLCIQVMWQNWLVENCKKVLIINKSTIKLANAEKKM